MMFRPSRARRAPDRWLPYRMFLFMIGGALGLAGMNLRISWLVTAGIIVLAAGLLLSFLARRRGRSTP